MVDDVQDYTHNFWGAQAVVSSEAGNGVGGHENGGELCEDILHRAGFVN